MNETKPQGGAASSLGAHSKDGAPGRADAPHGTGSTPGASSGTTMDTASAKAKEDVARMAREGMDRARAAGNEAAESAREGYDRAKATASDAAEGAREGMDRAKASIRDTAESAREAISTHGGHAMEATGRMVRDQPLTVLAVTGLACFALGVLVGRGRD
jgi:ElaB/YqjD/DUF883 family membrane-anchored ribosome-binding protein